MATNKPRTPCSRCKAKHTDDLRVLWWSAKGEPHGPLTREEGDIALCDKCAAEVYQGRNTVQSSLQVRVLRLSERKEFSAMCKASEVVPEDLCQKWLENAIILVAQIKDDFIGFCIFTPRPESLTSRTFFIDFEGIWVDKQWRGFGVGKKLFDEFVGRIAEVDIHYVSHVTPLGEDVREYLWSKVFDPVTGFDQCYIWKDVD